LRLDTTIADGIRTLDSDAFAFREILAPYPLWVVNRVRSSAVCSRQEPKPATTEGYWRRCICGRRAPETGAGTV